MWRESLRSLGYSAVWPLLAVTNATFDWPPSAHVRDQTLIGKCFAAMPDIADTTPFAMAGTETSNSSRSPDELVSRISPYSITGIWRLLLNLLSGPPFLVHKPPGCIHLSRV